MKTDAGHSVFISYNKSTFILVYVDNLPIISKNLNIINGLKNILLKHFCITDLGLVSHYLSMSIIRTENSISLDLKSYLKKVLLQFKIDICKSSSLPMDPRVSNSMLLAPENQQVDKDTIFWYEAIVGLLMYIMTMTCPNLRYALSMVNWYCANLNSTHIMAVLWILKYVHGSLYYGLTYTKDQLGFVGYTNTDWSSTIDGQQSTGEGSFMIERALISWSSKRQAQSVSLVISLNTMH